MKVVTLGVIVCTVMVLCVSAHADEAMTLAQKAALFEHDMRTRFMVEGQVACKMFVPSEKYPYPTYNMPDNAYMTGIVLGAFSMKYAVTKDPADRAFAGELLNGLHLLSTVSGKKGLLSRAAWPKDVAQPDDGQWHDSPDGKHVWRGDVSSDQMDGTMYGYAIAYDLLADEAQKKLIAQDVSDLVGTLLDTDLKIIDIDGKPTQFGKYMPYYVRLVEPMNALLLLQLLKIAHHVTGDERFAREYRRLAVDEKYAKTAVNARRQIFGNVNFSDDVLLFLAYYPLLKYETDSELRALYIQSLERTWNGVGRHPGANAQANPYYGFVANEYLKDNTGVAPGIGTLRWFPLDMKWNSNTIAGYEEKFGLKFDPAPQSPSPEPNKAVPVDRRVKSWSAWVMNPFKTAGDRTQDVGIEYNGHDYLMAYWLGRYLNLIPADM